MNLKLPHRFFYTPWELLMFRNRKIEIENCEGLDSPLRERI